MSAAQRLHGGADALGVPLHDFSTNAHACGPCPQAWAAVRGADATRYPDPAYAALREALAGLHGVAASRIVPAASASELIFRLTAWVASRGGRCVALPAHGYGDYAAAAQAWGMESVDAAHSDLAWACNPSSPLARMWQLWTPNKALGLTGVRGAYAIAPADADTGPVQALAPSWPLGAHAVAMLLAWCTQAAQHWLQESLATLRGWKTRQIAVCQELGWECLPSDANFFVAKVGHAEPGMAEILRTRGIKLRDCASFGLPGHVRLGVLAPASQDALREALQ